MSEITLEELKNKRTTSFYNKVRGTISFYYYISPLGYIFDNEKHNIAHILLKEI
jgi:hypothetical protein